MSEKSNLEGAVKFCFLYCAKIYSKLFPHSQIRTCCVLQFYSELLLGQYENQHQRGTPRGLGEEENIAYLNWGTEEQYQNILGNKGRKPIFKF